MKRHHDRLLSIFLFAGLIVALTAEFGLCQTPQEIFQWTARQMKIEAQLEMPPVHYVDAPELKRVFIDNNQNAYLRWETEYGVKRAREILQQYLDEIIGLYDVDTGVIYIGAFLSPCRRQAILAHEMTHYFQNKVRGTHPVEWQDAETMHFFREMEAYKIEKRFTEAFCKEVVSQATSR